MRRAFFTFPVTDGLLDATGAFAAAGSVPLIAAEDVARVAAAFLVAPA